jgi:hypothetical protein
MPLVAAAAIITGLAIWKPVQLSGLTDLLGGYVWARFWHFLVMVTLVVLTLGHVFMVFAVDPYALRAIVTGGYDETRSPEVRNARPFVNLRSRPQVGSAEPPPEYLTKIVFLPAANGGYWTDQGYDWYGGV